MDLKNFGRQLTGPSVFRKSGAHTPLNFTKISSAKTDDRKSQEKDYVARLSEALSLHHKDQCTEILTSKPSSPTHAQRIRIIPHDFPKEKDPELITLLHNPATLSNSANVNLSSKAMSMLGSKRLGTGSESQLSLLKEENELLKQVLCVLQENISVRQARFEQEVVALKQKAEALSCKHVEENGSDMQALRESHTAVLDEIKRIRSNAEEVSRRELQLLLEALGKQLAEKKEEVETMKISNKNSASEWSHKNYVLEQDLTLLAKRIDSLTETNTKLEELSRSLRIEYGAQADDSVILEKKLKKVCTTNQKLRDFIADCESELAVTKGRNHTDHLRSLREQQYLQQPCGRDIEHATNEIQPQEIIVHCPHEQALQRLQRLIRVENAYLQSMRTQHLQSLSQRTELEFILQKTLLQYRKSLQEDYVKGTRMKPDTFTFSDRRKVVELFLKNDRVLSLLYDPKSLAQQKDPRTTHELPPSPDEDENFLVEALWSKWLTWFHKNHVELLET